MWKLGLSCFFLLLWIRKEGISILIHPHFFLGGFYKFISRDFWICFDFHIVETQCIASSTVIDCQTTRYRKKSKSTENFKIPQIIKRTKNLSKKFYFFKLLYYLWKVSIKPHKWLYINHGKKKCEALKAIRKQIADLNNIQYSICSLWMYSYGWMYGYVSDLWARASVHRGTAVHQEEKGKYIENRRCGCWLVCHHCFSGGCRSRTNDECRFYCDNARVELVHGRLDGSIKSSIILWIFYS